MKILLIGEDNRTLALNQILKQKGLDCYLNLHDKLENLNDFDLIFVPIPCDNDTLKMLKGFKGKVIGGFLKNSYETLKELKLDSYNILQDEKFTLINAIITAEGAIEKLINQSVKSLFESSICITGYGRVSKALSQRLKNFTPNLVVYNNESLNFINAKVDNINIKPLRMFKEDSKNFDIIINTIPSLIINKEILERLDKNVLIMDLSSLTGGVDFETAKKENIKTIHYLKIPSKVSPYSSAKALSDCVNNFLK